MPIWHAISFIKLIFFLMISSSNKIVLHCVKSVHIRSYSGPYFPVFGLFTDQNNSEYGQFHTVTLFDVWEMKKKSWLLLSQQQLATKSAKRLWNLQILQWKGVSRAKLSVILIALVKMTTRLLQKCISRR